MDEQEYIKVTNRTRIGIALEVLKSVLADTETIDAIELEQMIKTLARWQMELFEQDDADSDE